MTAAMPCRPGKAVSQMKAADPYMVELVAALSRAGAQDLVADLDP